jgi:hypothetical protein
MAFKYTFSLLKKEKSHVVDYYRNTFHTLAARFFRPEYQSKVPANRQLDSRVDRYRRHPHHSEPSSCDLNLLDKDDSIESVEANQASTDANYCFPVRRIAIQIAGNYQRQLVMFGQ